jgi:hypothetical protein
MIIAAILIMVALFICDALIDIIWEKRNYNNGICKCCGKPLRHFDTDSQGGRLYTCPDFCSLVSVSHNCVDKEG